MTTTTTTRNNGDNVSGMIATAGIGLALVLGVTALALCRPRRAQQPVRDLEGMVVCLTGGNVGIGRAIAEALGRRGAKILMGCRNVTQAQGPNGVCQTVPSCDVFELDLANPASIEAFAKSIVHQTTRTGLHVLINNAGAMIDPGNQKTDDGYDRSMAVNHLGWVQLTRSLMPVLEKTAAATSTSTTATLGKVRVVNVGSRLEKMAVLPKQQQDPAQWDAWIKSYGPGSYSTFGAYSNSKLAMTAVTFYWAQQLQQQQASDKNKNCIQMMVVSPGLVNTTLTRFMPLWQRFVAGPFMACFLRTPQQGAESALYAATSPDAQSGRYYFGNGTDIRDTKQCSDAARSPEIERQIWDATMRTLEQRTANLS